ncbi:MAG: hypothetical protein GX628_03535 [Clostridiales bacterium]|nr:hypothetical protein [Clostridiales bacterium]
MKPKIKFGVFDIVLCVLLATALAVNIWAYLPRGEAQYSPPASRKPDSPGVSEADGVRGGYLSELSPDILEGEWDADMIMYSDSDQKIPYAIYELVFDIAHESGDSYSVRVTTADSRFADASVNPDVPPEGFAPALIDDEAFAELGENGSLEFWFSYSEDNVFSIFFKREEDGALTGMAYQTPDTGLPEGGMYTCLTLAKRRQIMT